MSFDFCSEKASFAANPSCVFLQLLGPLVGSPEPSPEVRPYWRARNLRPDRSGGGPRVTECHWGKRLTCPPPKHRTYKTQRCPPQKKAFQKSGW